MNADLRGVLLVLAAYAIGAIPWGVVLGRTVGGVDIRRLGSGGTGATNAQRILGWRVGLPVLVLDFLKGFLPILVGERLGVGAWWLALAAVAAVVGHCWSPYMAWHFLQVAKLHCSRACARARKAVTGARKL